MAWPWQAIKVHAFASPSGGPDRPARAAARPALSRGEIMTDVPTAAKAANDAARPQSRDEAILQAMREFEPRLENGERVTHAELATRVAELGHGDPPLTVQDVYAATAAFHERLLTCRARSARPQYPVRTPLLAARHTCLGWEEEAKHRATRR